MHLINDTYVEYLVSKLSNFYRDYMDDSKFLRVFLDTMGDVVLYIKNYADDVKFNTSLGTAKLYDTHSLHVINLRDSLYSVSTVAARFAAEGNGDWFSEDTSLTDKYKFLESMGLYDILASVPDGELVDAELMKDFSGQLYQYIRGKDFIIKDNKIYAFNDLAKPQIYGPSIKPVLSRNLTMDTNVLGNRWGHFIPEVDRSVLGAFEYKDFLQSVIGFTPTIRNLRRSLEALSGGSLSDVTTFRDSYSRKNLPLSALTTPSTLTPFEFMYHIPIEYAVLLTQPGDLEGDDALLVGRLTNIINFLNAMKPAQSAFHMNSGFQVGDNQISTDMVSIVERVSNVIAETLHPTDTVIGNIRTFFADTYVQNISSIYDDALAVYDTSIYDDDLRSTDFIQDAVTLVVS